MRYDFTKLNDSSAFDQYDYLIGKYDDKNGSSVKFFFNEKGNCKKVCFFDEDCISSSEMTIKQDFAQEIINSDLTENQIKEFINKLIMSEK